ncbi:hypothetical protein BE15_07160 [Sorangium cellulosum]|uniref:Secreted protein n=2 Tax=Sorangium cellulosum TaxID=56 RepID=A0A150QQS5_SORCE|nr:hypothetical protein BE15_07160 [Sorangium cellulosum]
MTMKRYPIVIALAVAGSFAGCWSNGAVQLYSCDDPCYGLELYECDDPCVVCEGGCLPPPPLGFDDPIVLWMSDASGEAPVPECPAEAPLLVFDGYGGFDAEHACPTCLCTEPSCELPRGLTGSASATCGGAAPTSFDAPEGWSGACAAPAAVSSGELGSLRIEAPTVSGCAPAIDPAGAPPELPAPWSARARGCAGSAAKHTCREPGKMCVAAPMPLPTGSAMCIRYLRSGAPKCPEEYPELRELYQGFDDTRSCTPCGCGPLEDSACAALVSAYEDASCGQLLGAETVTLAGPKCVAGPDLRFESMDARWIKNEPGSCAATGGVATGEVTPEGASFFCCQSDEVIAVP